MSRSRTITLATALVAGLTVPLIGIGAASAAPNPWERYVFEYGPEPSFCDGLIQHGVVTGKTRVTQHGDGSFYYYDEGEFTETWTNPDDPEDFATVTGTYKQTALKVTDNGDGTYQVLFSGPGTTNVYDGDTLVAHSAGLLSLHPAVRRRGHPRRHHRRPGHRPPRHGQAGRHHVLLLRPDPDVVG